MIQKYKADLFHIHLLGVVLKRGCDLDLVQLLTISLTVSIFNRKHMSVLCDIEVFEMGPIGLMRLWDNYLIPANGPYEVARVFHLCCITENTGNANKVIFNAVT